MAGTITHLVIADMLLGRMPGSITKRLKNLPLYYCGNLAPDAVMARDNYKREMKKHTHFKDGIPEDELSSPEYFRLYRQRFEAFANHFLTENNDYFELYFGYVTHILADEIFILTLRDRHVLNMQKAVGNPGYDEYKEYFTVFGHDVDLNDWRLLREYSFSCDILRMLRAENDYEIEGYITNDELIRSKSFIIKKNFLTPHEEEAPSLLMYSENADYIERTVNRIASALSDNTLSVTDDSSSKSAM